MLESKDILNYALTVSVLVVSFFFAWILYYVVKMLRDMERIMRDITGAVEKFNDVLDFVKDKISSVASVFPLIIQGGEKIADLISTIKEKKASKTKTTKRKSKSKQNEAEEDEA